MANNKRGFVYLLIDTKNTIEGFCIAKYGCTKAKTIDERVCRAKASSRREFDRILSVSVDDAHSSETFIKWNWRDSCGQLNFAGSEFVCIKPTEVDFAISEFKRLANGQAWVDKAA